MVPCSMVPLPDIRGFGDQRILNNMNLFFSMRAERFLHAPEHGGNAVKGGGHPSDESVPAEEEIRDAQGNLVPSRGRVMGTNDPGAPGSRTETAGDKPLEDESAHPMHHTLSDPNDKTRKSGS